MLRLVRVEREPRFCVGERRDHGGALARGRSRVPSGRGAEHEERALGVKLIAPLIKLIALPVELITLLKVVEREDLIRGETTRGVFVEAHENLVRAPAAQIFKSRAKRRWRPVCADEFAVRVPDREVADDCATRLDRLAA